MQVESEHADSPATYRLGRVLVSVEPGPIDTACHVWQGCVNSKGYGCRNVAGRRVLVHREAYERAHGPIPAALQVHHRCEQKRCLNPAHMRLLDARAHTRGHIPGGAIADRFLALLAGGDPWILMEAAAELGVARRSLDSVVSRCVQRGEVVRVAPGIYCLPGAGSVPDAVTAGAAA